MGSRNGLYFGITFLFIVSVIFGVAVLNSFENEDKPELTKTVEKKKEKEYKTYDMYVSLSPFVKLTFNAEYETCDDGKGMCFTGNSEIVDYELINEEAETIYEELEFKGRSIIDIFILLCDIAKANNILFDSVSITTNWMDMYDDEILKNEIKAKSKYEFDYDIFIDVRESINDEEIKAENESDEIIEFIVSFNRDNGDSIIKRKVKENEVVAEVKSGEKSGYTFIEWQLDGKKYDFNTPITKDITLIAKWEKGEVTTTTTTTVVSNDKSETPTQSTTTSIKAASTIDKINLNDNILVFEVTEKNKNYCYAQGWLATNFSDVFRGYLHESINNMAVYDNGLYLTDELISELSPNLVVDDGKVSSFLNQLDNIKNSTNPNITNFKYNYDSTTHKFSYSYQYLYSSNFSSLLNANKVDNILNNSIVNWTAGLCGGGDREEATVLNETLCSKYNLNCDRW